MSAERLRAVIFDVDGVVVDTVPLHFEAWKRMFGEYGISFTFADYKAKVDGISRMDGARAMLPDLSEEELKEAADRKQDYFLNSIENREIPVHASTIALIDRLTAKGIKVAAISSSKNCVPILTKIGLMSRLDAVVDGHAITRGKPDPQCFLMAVERLGVRPSEVVVVEDAVLGVEAARQGGMRCVGIDRYGDPRRLRLADRVVSDLTELDVADLERLVT